jgi:DmsE family decaheme c-type cytochrome
MGRGAQVWQRLRAGRQVHGSATAMLLFLGVCSAALADVSEEYANASADECLACHDAASDRPAHQILRTPHALTADPRTPFAGARRQCESCHGPSQAHLARLPDGTRPPPGRTFAAGEPAAERSAVCLSCHQDVGRLHWHSSVHELESVACSDCHRLHIERDPVLAINTQPQVCFTCHQRQRAEFLRPSRHPVQAAGLASRAGQIACTDCHDPHGSLGPAQLVKDTLNETCYDCHAELRGPFLWEHAPAREDCSNCHTPHGSHHEKLLTTRVPWLCQQCHLAQFHPSMEISGMNAPPQGRLDLLLARGCVNCHSNVHGSNHPSGVRLTR